jgi:hypothetical protein
MDKYGTCPVCGQETLKLVPCSHWECHRCRYYTTMSDESEAELLKKWHKRASLVSIKRFVDCGDGTCSYTFERCKKRQRKGECKKVHQKEQKTK